MNQKRRPPHVDNVVPLSRAPRPGQRPRSSDLPLVADESVAFAPLLGFACDADRIDLGPGLGIAALSQQDRNYLGRCAGPDQGASHAICCEYAEPDMTYGAGLADLVLRVVSALRLFKQCPLTGGWIGVRTVHAWTEGSPQPFAMSMEYAPDVSAHAYRLEGPEVLAFASFWKVYGLLFATGPLEHALSRFSSSRGFSSTDETLVHLTIAAEALFLSENVRDELRYKSSLRAAFFLGANAEERKDVFKTTRLAYDMRSWIVHGKTTKPEKLPAALKDEERREELVRDYGEVMRRALLKAADMAVEGNWPPEWDEMILGI